MNATSRRLAAAAAWVMLVLGGVALAWTTAERAGVRSLRESTTHRLDIYAAGLQSELSRYDYLPPVIALNQDVVDLLKKPGDAPLMRDANKYLETVAAESRASAVYVMDTRGLTLAASNWNQPVSFMRMNFSYRPYFQDAMRGTPGRFYGIGTVSREPGYYFSQGIMEGGRRIGVAAVKVNLDKLDQAWGHSSEKILVADGNGVVFLSSQPEWKFRTLNQLSPETMGQLALTRQYTEAGALAPLGLNNKRSLSDGSAIVHMPALDGAPASEYLVQSRVVPGTDWQLIVLSDMGPVTTLARNSAVGTACGLAFLTLLFMYLRQRRRIVAQSLAAKEALQRAHDELERKVQLRTEALSDANLNLQSEIVERMKAEKILKATLEDLVHTGKMAVLGQMSAGITHELNQPLAALRTLSANTIVFLERGQNGLAESNLRTICQLTDRMGEITAQLKKFARKSAANLQPVPITGVIADSLFLLGQRLRNDKVQVEQDVQPSTLQALCEGNRLEQVLVNLLANALDAMKHSAVRRLRIAASRDGQWVTIEVHDSGEGIPADVAARLFEPFFTTKEQGVGLGLGLAISAGIVRDFGGSLRAGPSRLGGAMFSIQLKATNGETAPAAEMEYA